MGLYLHGKKLTLLQTMNSVGLHSKNIMNSVGIFNDCYTINNIVKEYYWYEQYFLQIFLGWTIIPMHSVEITTPSKMLSLARMYE